mmetsp:Transcript_78970/g.221355  ORF Transcript_78970/g.221355 Transcript_78970/m.221355 type:complete len:354 (+) Transcript_78970:855-1916(+)
MRQHGNLVPQLAQLGLLLLELLAFVAQRRGVVLQLVLGHEGVPLLLLVLALLPGQVLRQDVPLLLQLLLLLEHLLLPLADEIRLLLVHCEPRVLVVLADLRLEVLDVRGHRADLLLEVLQVRLRHRRVAQRGVDLPPPRHLLVALPRHAHELLPRLAHVAAEHPQHRLRGALALPLRFLHLPQLRGALDVELLRQLQLVALLRQLLRDPRLLLLLLPQPGRHLKEHLEALVRGGSELELLDLLRELLPLGVQLRDLPLQLRGVHPPLPLLLQVRVRRLELRLQLLVLLKRLQHLLLAQELLRDIEVHAELCQVGPLPQRIEVVQQPVEYGMDGGLFSGHQTLLELDVEGALVA